MDIKTIESKPVKDRTTEEHNFLIKEKYLGNIREYLLSMGKFKDVPIEDDWRLRLYYIKAVSNYYHLGDDIRKLKDKIDPDNNEEEFKHFKNFYGEVTYDAFVRVMRKVHKKRFGF